MHNIFDGCTLRRQGRINWHLYASVVLATKPIECYPNSIFRLNVLLSELKRIIQKVLSTSLKDLELNEFVTQTVYSTSQVTVEYELTKYSQSLNEIMMKCVNGECTEST